MNVESIGKEYVVGALGDYGMTCPDRYIEMLRRTPIHRAIEGLRPWYFDHDPASAVQFCSEAAGRTVLPFAQAVEEDMMACFVPKPFGEPAVVVINPWSEDKTSVVQARLPNYDAWLDYATEVARQVQAREADEDDD